MYTLSNKGYGKAPQPGELNRIIYLGYTRNTQDEHGYPVAEDVQTARLFAKLEKSGYNAVDTAGLTSAVDGVNVTIRYREGIETGMWVKYEGTKYLISDVNLLDYKRQYLSMRTMAQAGIGG